MKRTLLTTILGLIGLFCVAQTATTPEAEMEKKPLKPGLSFKRLWMDYQTLNGGDFGALRDYRNGFEVGVHLPLSEQFMVNIPVKIGLGKRGNEIINSNILGMDAQAHYYLIKNPNLFRPYVLAGFGAAWQEKDFITLQIPVGLGLDVKIAERAFFNLQSEFRYSTRENNNNFHHGIGFKYFFGKDAEEEMIPDADADGIPDAVDDCPLLAGVTEFNGCPDTDGDKVPDNKDACPDLFGLVSLEGCPDSDGDGISDPNDACPTTVGPASNNGCPEVRTDTDGDGVFDDVDLCPDKAGLAKFSGCPDSDGDDIEDSVDKCPTKAGLAEFGGCPDTDKDGIEDSKDACPNTYGPVSNNGCPIIEKQDRETLTFAMKAVQFELGKATLKSESYTILNQIVNILKKYPDYHLKIEGHTDNTGTADVNHRLSENRAKACYDYLVQKGITASRLTHKGYGPTRPIADNSTYSGRTLNRRVEFNMVPPPMGN